MNLCFGEEWMAMLMVPLAGMVIATKAQVQVMTPAAGGDAPAFLLPALPYTQDALEPQQGLRRGIPGPSSEPGLRGVTVEIV